jgi:hypothetical protein
MFIFLTFILIILLVFIDSKQLFCGPGLKLNELTNTCISITTTDVLKSLNWISSPPKTIKKCKNINTIQGIDVCEDNIIDGKCLIWSTISTLYCDNLGTLEFEKYWSKRCDVVIYHFTVNFKGNLCNTYPVGNSVVDHPNINIIRGDMWAAKCYNCIYTAFPKSLPESIDVFKIQLKGDVITEEFEGSQFVILSDLFTKLPNLANVFKQIVVKVAINSETLIDTVGREGENGWNMFASSKFLQSYASFSTRKEKGLNKLQPLQFEYQLTQAQVDPTIGYYYHSFIKINDENIIKKNQLEFDNWKQLHVNKLHAEVPPYCKIPSIEEDDEMQKWINEEINYRCHPTRLWVPCDFNRGYDAFIPCPQELMDKLADDYSSTKGWCDFKSILANVPSIVKVDASASDAFQKSSKPRGSGVRLAFLFTIYADAEFVERLFLKLYGKDHYYLFHVDPTGSTPEFEREISTLASRYDNVFVASDVPIVYGASTATILLSKTMAWFLNNAKGWDYMVGVTGSDYPLVPLNQLEKILNHQSPPMPFVMAWTPGTSTHIFRLTKTVPQFEYDPQLQLSIKAVTDERGKQLGAVPMEYRSNNFGPPLMCNNRQSFYHLDNRRNKTGTRFDTQWLFPRDKFRGRGRAYAEFDRTLASPSFDGVFREWKKSDPATTGIFDWETVNYIVKSEEGRKYFHFFQHMLLGSEEHYYVSLLYNWDRTKSFVQTLSAESAWNTWTLGLWEQSGGGFQTHTHFLTTKEWEIIKALSKRGMMFARKFSHKKNRDLIDMIDRHILLNSSTDAGSEWPGFYHVDTWTYGRGWVNAYRNNATIQALEKKIKSKFLNSNKEVVGNVAARPKLKPKPNSATKSSLQDESVDGNGMKKIKRGKNSLKVISQSQRID